MCKCHETDFNCNQGRSCPQRIEYAGDEPPRISDLVIAVLITFAIAWICWLAIPELRGLISFLRN